MNQQAIDLLRDTVISIDGYSVIDETDQETLGIYHGISSVPVAIDLWDTVSNSHVGPVNATMTYQTTVDWWTIDVADIASSLADRHKYVANITEQSPYTNNMRAFKIHEFYVDNESFEATLMRLPFQIEIAGGEAWVRWYETTGDFGTPANAVYKAPAYEGGVGTTYATDPSRVTHRGAVVTN